MSTSPPNRMPLEIVLLPMLVQTILLGVITFGDFGFYFPGAMGDWGDWMLWISSYLVVLVVGVLVAAAAGRYVLVLTQLAAPLLVGSLVLLLALLPGPRYSAADYQHLVGKTAAEAERELGRPVTSGMMGYDAPDGGNGSRDFKSYNGMMVFLIDGKVVEVQENLPGCCE